MVRSRRAQCLDRVLAHGDADRDGAGGVRPMPWLSVNQTRELV